jgi:pimeloyl-ACP methyl ester carboxylesterase
MSTFGLVHGGGFGAWCWDRVIPELTARGHRAEVVDLTTDDLATGAAHCAEAITHAFAAIEDPVLVGHSIAGLIIPLVAMQAQVRGLVFLHALLPRPGESVVDQLTVEPDMLNPEMFTASAPFWEDESVAATFLFHDCPPEIAREAYRRLRPEPGVLGSEVTPLTAWPDVPAAYIVCAGDRTATPAWARRAARERLGVEPIELRGDTALSLLAPRSSPKPWSGAPDRAL